MTMTKEQFKHYERSYERMEAIGGPKSQSEAMLYHQYKQQKAAVAEALEMGKENYQRELLAKVAEVHRLEGEIAQLQQRLYLEHAQVDKMLELMDQF
ncbi:hypothetical protein C8U37_11560 [Trichococcus patagoniensis]|uniref:Uncharacterized protein n=1 Tax=Trichococcus patagoniensis TaxID=382641 RepID=A0A2T5IGN0_9LACT|nr:hypothetical protein [Trichococcus patagoniensis]PTQ82983.1 hypothetical protein C8U37_11560 [Trichococcus patagoniensis]